MTFAGNTIIGANSCVGNKNCYGLNDGEKIVECMPFLIPNNIVNRASNISYHWK